MSLSTYHLEYGPHVTRLRRRRRRRRRRRPRRHVNVSTSNTASHDNRDNHEKFSSWVSFSLPYECGAPLGGPSGSRSSATSTDLLFLGAKLSVKNLEKL